MFDGLMEGHVVHQAARSYARLVPLSDSQIRQRLPYRLHSKTLGLEIKIRYLRRTRAWVTNESGTSAHHLDERCEMDVSFDARILWLQAL
jgi:hypothetical protein